MTDLEFLIIGTQKAGTTSLYNYLSEHPKVFVPEVKEIQFFVDDRFYIQGPDYLNPFFNKAQPDELKGMAYVHMLPFDQCPKRVAEYNPNLKLIVMLRDPIKRAFSAYNFAIKNGWEKRGVSFEKSFELEAERLKGNYTEKYELAYFYNGLYHRHLTNWAKHFNLENMLVLKDSDLRFEREATLKRVFRFLRVDEFADIDLHVEHNRAGGVKNPILQKVLLDKEAGWKRKLGAVVPTSMKVALRAKVIKPVMEWNKTEALNRPMTQTEVDLITPYFKDDLAALKRDFNISFE
ncbi:MAG: hypothetical protein ACI85F_001145 [Bacteroidia bacterium]|jgi:hypothetical protein